MCTPLLKWKMGKNITCRADCKGILAVKKSQ